MKQLFIKRVSASYGQVLAHTWNDKEQLITKIIPYEQCMDYVRIHQKDLTVYKVGFIAERKNARRKLKIRILAESQDQAEKIFRGQYNSFYEEGTYQLCTGDWKVLLKFIKIKEN